MTLHGILPACLCPFTPDLALDSAALAGHVDFLARQSGVGGIVCNGHAGEVSALTRAERVEVLTTVVSTAARRVPVIAGISAESTAEAVEYARDSEAAGADALLVFPPHVWLRMGKNERAPREFFQAIRSAVRLPLAIFQYPVWTRASYSTAQLLDLTAIDGVVAIKMGTRDMIRYETDLRLLREHRPHVALFTSHDEYLLPTLVVGADGCLVGFAAIVPELIASLFAAVQEGDLKAARAHADRLFPLTQVLYHREPFGDCHTRIKEALVMMGRLPSAAVRPPLVRLDDAERRAIGEVLRAAALLPR